MTPKFEIIFLKEAREFLLNLEEKDRKKIIYNIDKVRFENDPKLFKKLHNEIWEFRTRFNKVQYRLFAFWDKRDSEETLVVSTHGIIKKTSKISKKEIDKAEDIREKYFQDDKN